MNVSLTPELEDAVNRMVESGRYNSACEVVREGLRLVIEQEQQRLKLAIQQGICSFDRREGKPRDLAYFKAEGRRRLAQLK